MTRYLIFTICSSILTMFILAGAPIYSRINDIFGLIILSIGSGLYLKETKTAGIVSIFGLGFVFHVINMWWFNLYNINFEVIITSRLIVAYIALTTIAISLLVLAFYSIIKGSVFNNGIDKLKLNKRIKITLIILPTVLIVSEILILKTYFRLL